MFGITEKKKCCKHQTHVRQQEHAPRMEERGGQSGNKDGRLKGTGGHSDAARSYEHRGPLPELYECEPLSERVEAVRLMKPKIHWLVKKKPEYSLAESLGGVTYSAAAGLDSGAACAASSGRHVEVGWRTRHGFEACTSEARRPEEPSPAQWGSARANTLTSHRQQRRLAVLKGLGLAYLSQEFALLLPHPGLVPQCDLQHPLPELPPVHRRIHKGLVPLGF